MGKAAAIGASAIALGATIYYFLGPKAEQHQKSAKKWTVDAKKKIIKEISKSKDITESVYGNIVDNVVKPYISEGATAGEVVAFAKALKKDWKHIISASKASMKKAVTKTKGKRKS